MKDGNTGIWRVRDSSWVLTVEDFFILQQNDRTKNVENHGCFCLLAYDYAAYTSWTTQRKVDR